ncbi:hypothetical protein HanRHA438_Chr07g0313601 [Helianthus annuus]|nr:hypothetical protein HanRHA438_Chr07g0313601 [Helianthus annuus]
MLHTHTYMRPKTNIYLRTKFTPAHKKNFHQSKLPTRQFFFYFFYKCVYNIFIYVCAKKF